MAIREFRDGRERRRIGVFGEQPNDAGRSSFEERGFEVVEYSASDLADPIKLQATDAVVFSQRTDKPLSIARELAEFAPLLLNFDCRVYVRVAKSDALREKAREIVVNALFDQSLPPAQLTASERARALSPMGEREGVALAPFVYLCDSQMSWLDVAQVATENPAGKSPNLDLRIEAIDPAGEPIQLGPNRVLLLQRAFYDCAVVHLQRMTDGLSGAPVFQAHAELSKGLLGRWPQVYFVKIGDRRKISDEYSNYQGNAQAYLPYHLGPRLTLERCGLGANEGILVGDFVEGAESIRDCARERRAGRAIATLFDSTLRPWHEVSQRDETGSISAAFMAQFPTEIPPDRLERARTLGAGRSLQELRNYFTRIKSVPVITGPIHGDLHATNVLVRGGDAIVIDFEKATFPKPILYDFASLEGGLLVEGAPADKRVPAEWLASISCMYEIEGLVRGFTQCHPRDRSAWYFDVVRQIRLYARQFECIEAQYGHILAYSLLRKASNPHRFDERVEWLRAGAYVLGERILVALVNRQKAPSDDKQ